MGNGNIYQNKQQYSTCCVYCILLIYIIYKYPSAFIHVGISNVDMYILIYLFHMFFHVCCICCTNPVLPVFLPNTFTNRGSVVFLGGTSEKTIFAKTTCSLTWSSLCSTCQINGCFWFPWRGLHATFWGVICYHLLREPETTIDQSCDNPGPWVPDNEGVYPVQPSIFRGELAVKHGSVSSIIQSSMKMRRSKKIACAKVMSLKLVGGFSPPI